MIRVSVLSQVTVRMPYVEVDGNGDLNDPTGVTPQFAVVDLDTDPAGGDWANGSWETSTDSIPIGLVFTQVDSPYKARYTIDATALSAGSEYHLWFKLSNYVTKVDKVEVT